MLSAPPSDGPEGHIQLHASTVSIDGKAVSLLGPSGCGKSSLAFAFLALGGSLISDDVTWIRSSSKGAMACCPPSIRGRIEAWGLGILSAQPVGSAPLSLIVDLGHLQTQRHPAALSIRLFNHDVPVVHKVDTPHFAATILHYVRHQQTVDTSRGP